MSVSTEQFQVIGPYCPIVAVLGEDAILPCALVPAMNAENMEQRWFCTTFSQAVFIYWNQLEHTEEQMAEYRGRTSLVKDFLSEGQAAVHIHKVQVSDIGMYTCFFRHGGFYEEADLEVKVAGMGSAPQVRIEGPEEDGVRVVCTASGWFLKPQVQWRDLSGNKFPALSEAHTQDSEELFSVEATLVVRDSSVGNVTCSVLNPVLGQEKAMAIYIPEPFFPQASPWKPAFAVILTVLGLLLLGACYFITKAHSRRMQVRQERSICGGLRRRNSSLEEGYILEIVKNLPSLSQQLILRDLLEDIAGKYSPREYYSPTLCQKYVDRAIAPIRNSFPNAYIILFMDEILLAHANRERGIKKAQEVGKDISGFQLFPVFEQLNDQDKRVRVHAVIPFKTIKELKCAYMEEIETRYKRLKIDPEKPPSKRKRYQKKTKRNQIDPAKKLI
uniref:butyrophilin subfamily 1 member A1-like n=1 Tax=Urocitellus parryii TaxID=9999 RepID=UPI000E55C0DA|nr:butyrophilin subfamily 1 member A1-like [Urocitellus parryii]